MANQMFSMYITNLDGDSRFLRVSGQLNKQTALKIEALIEESVYNFENRVVVADKINLRNSLICAAKYSKDQHYYRAKILHFTNDGRALVHFVDYGNKDVVDLTSIRLLDDYPSELSTIPPQAADFLLARVMHPSGTWDVVTINNLYNAVCNANYQCLVEKHTITRDILISFPFKGRDFSEFLCVSGYAIRMTVVRQEQILHEYSSGSSLSDPTAVSFSFPPPTFTQIQPLLSQPPPRFSSLQPTLPLSHPPFRQSVIVQDTSPIPQQQVALSQVQKSHQANKQPKNISPLRPVNRSVPSMEKYSINELNTSAGSPVKEITMQPKVTPPSTRKDSYKMQSTFKTRMLEINSQHKVRISYSEDGPKLFAIQLDSTYNQLQSMMEAINIKPHRTLTEPPSIGSVCLGRYSEDKVMCRAVVMGTYDQQCNLFFVDFGVTEMVSYYDVFDIPEEFVKPSVYALRFCLSGVKELDHNKELIKTFRELVHDKVLELKVVPPEGPPLIQYGELYLDGLSIKDILRERCQPTIYKFNKLPVLTVNSDYSVLVSFVDSCTNFYIQLSDNIDSLNDVMGSVDTHCKNSEKLNISRVRLAMACCALFPDDSNWYRAEVVSINGDKVTVRYIDYGNEQEVTADVLRPITEKLLKLKAQAIRCTLKGYEGKPVKQTASNQLEMLALEKTLMSHVYELLDDGSVLIDLLDETCTPPLDIARRMAELAQPRHSRGSTDSHDKPLKVTKSAQDDSFDDSPQQSTSPKYEKQGFERHDKPKYDRQGSRGEKSDWPKKELDSSKSFRSGGENRSRNRRDDFDKTDKAKDDDFSQGSTAKDNRNDTNNKESPKDTWGEKPSFKPKSRDFKSRDDNRWDNNRRDDSRRNNNRSDSRRNEGKWNEQPKSSFSDADSDKSFGGGYKPRSRFTTTAEPKFLSKPSPLDVEYTNLDIELQSQHEVSITWFISPDSFYVQLSSVQQQLSTMMQTIPDMYKGVGSYSGMLGINSTVMARFPEDSVLYRATVLAEKPGNKYQVQYIDFGNKSTVDTKDIWQADSDILTLPRLALHCKLEGVAPLTETWQNGSDIDACFNAPRYQCIFHCLQEDGKYVVSLWNNSTSVAQLLIERALANSADSALSAVLKDEPIDLNIIVTQQLICKVSHVVSMSKLFLQIDPAKAENVENLIRNYKTENLRQLALENIVDGCHCVIKTKEGLICRAILSDASDKDNVKATLPDNGQDLTISSQNIMALPDELTVFYYQSFECCLHNFAPESSKVLMTEDEFNTNIHNKKFIAYIDAATEGRLEVTLYDCNSGSKVEFFTPDENAYEHVLIPRPRPVFNENFGIAFVSHAESLNQIYLQKLSDSDLITGLLDAMFQFYETDGKGEILPNIEEDVICAAKSPDGNWYRAEVLKSEDDNCQVQYIDYGNCDSIPKSDIKKLDTKFNEPYSLALKVTLGLSPSCEDAVNKFLEMTSEKEIQVTLTPGEVWIASLYAEGIDLGMKLVADNLAAFEKATIADVAEQNCEDSDRTPGSTLVYITHIDTPGQFWIQLASNVDTIENIQAQLQATGESLSNLEKVDIGTLCIAKYSADEQWYRAEVLDSDNDIITVRFIDYGNTDVLDNIPGLIKESPSDFDAKERYALKCSVNATPTGTGQWTEPASELFTSSIGSLDEPVDALIILKDVTTYVDLYVDGKNITDNLVSNGFASKSDREESGGLATCFASHINSPSEFWVQLESSIPDLQLIENEMAVADTFPPLADAEEGVICAAKFPEDEMWYRAQIIINGSNGTEVLFMDYGNASLTDELRSLPDDLKAKPALSRKCALQKPGNIKSWTQRAEQKFSELAADGAAIFNIQFIASGDISIVELYLNEMSVTEELVSLCESPLSAAERPSPIGQDNLSKGSIISCASPNDFYLRLEESSVELEAITEILLDSETNDKVEDVVVGQLYAGRWTDDNEWYRSKVLSESESSFRVLFIDFGNCGDCKELRALEDCILEAEPLAKHCTLGISENNDSYDELKAAFEELTLDRASVFDVEILDSNSDPILVKLFSNGENLSTKFNVNLNNRRELHVDNDAAVATEDAVSTSVTDENETNDENDRGVIAFDTQEQAKNATTGILENSDNQDVTTHSKAPSALKKEAIQIEESEISELSTENDYSIAQNESEKTNVEDNKTEKDKITKSAVETAVIDEESVGTDYKNECEELEIEEKEHRGVRSDEEKTVSSDLKENSISSDKSFISETEDKNVSKDDLSDLGLEQTVAQNEKIEDTSKSIDDNEEISEEKDKFFDANETGDADVLKKAKPEAESEKMTQDLKINEKSELGG